MDKDLGLGPTRSSACPYLQCNIGKLITTCLVDVVNRRPADPIDFIARWLYHYADTRLYFIEKARMNAALEAMQQAERRMSVERTKRIALMKATVTSCQQSMRKGHIRFPTSSEPVGILKTVRKFVESSEESSSGTLSGSPKEIDERRSSSKKSSKTPSGSSDHTHRHSRSSRESRRSGKRSYYEDDVEMEYQDLGSESSNKSDESITSRESKEKRRRSRAASADKSDDNITSRHSKEKRRKQPDVKESWRGLKTTLITGIRIKDAFKGRKKAPRSAEEPKDIHLDPRRQHSSEKAHLTSSGGSTESVRTVYSSSSCSSVSSSSGSGMSSGETEESVPRRKGIIGAMGVQSVHYTDWEGEEEHIGEKEAWFKGMKSKHHHHHKKRHVESEDVKESKRKEGTRRKKHHKRKRGSKDTEGTKDPSSRGKVEFAEEEKEKRPDDAPSTVVFEDKIASYDFDDRLSHSHPSFFGKKFDSRPSLRSKTKSLGFITVLSTMEKMKKRDEKHESKIEFDVEKESKEDVDVSDSLEAYKDHDPDLTESQQEVAEEDKPPSETKIVVSPYDLFVPEYDMLDFDESPILSSPPSEHASSPEPFRPTSTDVHHRPMFSKHSIELHTPEYLDKASDDDVQDDIPPEKRLDADAGGYVPGGHRQRKKSRTGLSPRPSKTLQEPDEKGQIEQMLSSTALVSRSSRTVTVLKPEETRSQLDAQEDELKKPSRHRVKGTKSPDSHEQDEQPEEKGEEAKEAKKRQKAKEKRKKQTKRGRKKQPGEAADSDDEEGLSSDSEGVVSSSTPESPSPVYPRSDVEESAVGTPTGRSSQRESSRDRPRGGAVQPVPTKVTRAVKRTKSPVLTDGKSQDAGPDAIPGESKPGDDRHLRPDGKGKRRSRVGRRSKYRASEDRSSSDLEPDEPSTESLSKSDGIIAASKQRRKKRLHVEQPVPAAKNDSDILIFGDILGDERGEVDEVDEPEITPSATPRRRKQKIRKARKQSKTSQLSSVDVTSSTTSSDLVSAEGSPDDGGTEDIDGKKSRRHKGKSEEDRRRRRRSSHKIDGTIEDEDEKEERRSRKEKDGRVGERKRSRKRKDGVVDGEVLSDDDLADYTDAEDETKGAQESREKRGSLRHSWKSERDDEGRREKRRSSGPMYGETDRVDRVDRDDEARKERRKSRKSLEDEVSTDEDRQTEKRTSKDESESSSESSSESFSESSSSEEESESVTRLSLKSTVDTTVADGTVKPREGSEESYEKVKGQPKREEKAMPKAPRKTRSKNQDVAGQVLQFASWALEKGRLVCNHPRLGDMGGLQSVRIEPSVEDWESFSYACHLLYDQEIYTSCATDKSETMLPFRALGKTGVKSSDRSLQKGVRGKSSTRSLDRARPTQSRRTSKASTKSIDSRSRGK